MTLHLKYFANNSSDLARGDDVFPVKILLRVVWGKPARLANSASGSPVVSTSF